MVPRPVLVSLPGVTRLHVDGVTLINSPSFHLAPSGQDITMENLHVVAPSDSPNTDALDPGGQRIVIRKCELDIGDDNVALKNGGHDILIEDLTCLHGHGISIGSGTRDGFSHIIVRRCTFDGTDNGLRIKSYRGGGGEVHDIRYSDITMRYVRRPFDINMLYNGNAGLPSDVGPRQAEPSQTEHIPNFHDIHVTNLTVIASPVAGRILGLPELPANNITFTNVKFQTARGFLIQDAKDVIFQNVRIDAAVGAALVLDNGSLKFNGISKSGTSGGSPDVFYVGN
jgi:polygalacturonase